jgi:DNA-binding response OmpR family regulator
LKHPNEIITFESLYEVLWDYDETPSSESLRAHIKNLRKHLAKDMIQNLRGLGYRFEMKAPH